MRCPRCSAQMVEGHVGKGEPLNMRFVPDDTKFFVWDYARVVAHACPLCGGVQFAVDPNKLAVTRSQPAPAAHAALG